MIKEFPDLFVRVLTRPVAFDLKRELGSMGCQEADISAILNRNGMIAVKMSGVPRSLMSALKERIAGVGGEVISAFSNPDSPIGCALLIGSRRQFDEAFSPLVKERPRPLLGELAYVIIEEIEQSLLPVKLPNLSDVCHPALKKMFERLSRRSLVMGVLNVTPDSFSDGGRHTSHEEAIEYGIRMVDDGADIIDVGGESTRPGSEPVSETEELDRILPVVYGLAAAVDVPISIDTSKSEVARFAMMGGATIINDVTGCKADPEIAAVAAHHQGVLVIMHMKGTPRNMQEDPHYENVVDEVYLFLKNQVIAAMDKGMPEEMIIVDPGFGFGKNPEHNLELLRRLDEFLPLRRPVMIGTSRKSTLGKVTGGLPPSERLEATAASVAMAIANGASIVRVHDVKEMVRVARTADAVIRSLSS